MRRAGELWWKSLHPSSRSTPVTRQPRSRQSRGLLGSFPSLIFLHELHRSRRPFERRLLEALLILEGAFCSEQVTSVSMLGRQRKQQFLK